MELGGISTPIFLFHKKIEKTLPTAQYFSIFVLCNTKHFVMNTKIQEELSHIRSMMEKSTRFLSLSGWAGIMAGIYALTGAFFAYRIIYRSQTIIYYDITGGIFSKGAMILLGIALVVFLLTLATAIYTSSRTAQKSGKKLWTPAALKMIFNMAIPLVTGGILAIILIQKGAIGLVAPVTLIFYGLSLIAAANYTYSNVKVLGVFEIIIGLIASYFQGYGLFFWALGFGVFHIIYGIFMYLKYKK